MMGKSMYIFLALSILGVVFVIVFRTGLRRRFIKNREPLGLEQIFEREVKGHGISYGTFRRVYEVLEHSFSLDIRFVRPSDSVKDIIALDSWDLWVGKEKMEKWMAENLQVRADAPPIRTVMDLLRVAEESTIDQASTK